MFCAPCDEQQQRCQPAAGEYKAGQRRQQLIERVSTGPDLERPCNSSESDRPSGFLNARQCLGLRRVIAEFIDDSTMSQPQCIAGCHVIEDRRHGHIEIDDARHRTAVRASFILRLARPPEKSKDGREDPVALRPSSDRFSGSRCARQHRTRHSRDNGAKPPGDR